MGNTDYRKFNNRTLNRKKESLAEFDSTSTADNMQKLYKYEQMYESLRKFRDKRERCRDYAKGQQGNDKIEDPQHPGSFITEDQHIKNQGKVPIYHNMIGGQIKSILGQFRGNQTEPSCVARDRDEAKLGEMMSIALQYSYQTNKKWEKDARALEEFLVSGLVCQKVRYEWNQTKQIMDARVLNVNPMRLFFNSDVEDASGEDFSVIGEIMDMSLADLLATFCSGNREKALRISKMYNSIDSDLIAASYESLTKRKIHNLSFYIPTDPTKCRVIEAWEKESKERLRVHDYLNAEVFVTELDQKKAIDLINIQRIQDATSQGVAQEDVRLMEYEWFLDQFWYVRYLTPLGDVLYESETPFKHKESPFVIKISMFDGEVHSFVHDLIDLSRGINRMATLVDFIISASPKGTLIMDEGALGDMRQDEIQSQYAMPGGVVVVKLKPGVEKPYVLSQNSTNVGAYELLNLYMNSLQEVSGVHGAMQGKNSTSGTPSSLYAQQAQNSSINILDMLETFKSFREDVDSKLMKTIQQYYDEPRYINIAGADYSEESKWYNPEKIRNTDFDLAINESSSTPAYRTINNNLLLDMFKAQAIGVEELLKAGSFPFGDKLLEMINEKKKAMEQGQGGQMNIPPEVQQQMQQGQNPQATQMLQQGMQQ